MKYVHKKFVRRVHQKEKQKTTERRRIVLAMARLKCKCTKEPGLLEGKIARNRGGQLQEVALYAQMNELQNEKNIISKKLVLRQLFRLSPTRQIE